MKSIKFKLMFFAFLLSASSSMVKAQVKITDGINQTLDANSLLELESSDKGVLIPRVAINNLSLEAPLTSPVPVGMLVFSSGGSVSDGFYFWNGSQWKLFVHATVQVSDGGTGITSGTSGGIPAYTGTTTLSSSGVLVQNAIVIGGGVGSTPSTLSTGTADQVLVSNGTAAPSWQETEKIVYLNSNLITTSTSLVDAAGLSFTLEANKDYFIEVHVIYLTTASNRGIQLSVNGPAPPVDVAFSVMSNVATGITSTYINSYDGGSNLLNSNSNNNYAIISGLVRNGSNAGTFTLRFASETGSQVDIKKGSILKYRKLN